MKFKSACSNESSTSNFQWAFILLLLFGLQTHAQDTSLTKEHLRAIADAVIKDATFDFVDKNGDHGMKLREDSGTGTQLQLGSRYADWRYWNGVLNLAMFKLGNEFHNQLYSEYPLKQVAFCFDGYHYFRDRYKAEGKWNYPFGQFFILEELDDCGAMGASVIQAYRQNKQDRYRQYIDLAANHIEKIQSRLEDGTLVRPFPRKWTLWADDLYMSVSFLARMGELTGNIRYFDDAAQQVVNFHKYLFDEGKGLLRHCWYSDVRQPGIAFWGRANGWAMVAQVDLLDRIPKGFPQRDTLLSLLRKDIRGIAQYQGESGLWHQLLDKADSYSETSCTAMFTYTIARAVNRGYVDTSFVSIARHGWLGVMSKIRSDGQIEGVCTGTGVGDNLEFYFTRPTPLNDVHGVGAVLLAGAEVLNLRD
jgi:unsaturated rhamnogalacturonyl hydrolase